MENLEKEQIKKDYLNGYNLTDIMKKYHHKYETIVKVLDENNIPHGRGIRTKNKENIKNRKNLTEDQKKLIIKNYNNGHGLHYCAKIVGVSNPEIVKRVLKENNIHIRDFYESKLIASERHDCEKNKKRDYFQKESSNMAWLLGFLASDGTIRLNSNEIKIGLAKKDKEILEKIKKELEIEREIKEYTTKDGFDCVSLSWTSAQHKKDLATYGIIPQKTNKLIPPYSLNKKYWIDYIRGYFDGDGSINLIKNSNGRGNGNLRWQICAATPEILEFIINWLYEQYQIPKVNILIQKKKNPLYYPQYSSSATREIYKILYTPNSLYLKRKKDKFEEVLSKVKPLVK